VLVITESDIRAAALDLPGAFEQPSYGGRPSWRTKARMFTWLREEPEALVVWVESVEEKLAMIEAEPDKFFTTDHYDASPIVLVALDGIDVDEMTELLIESWRLRAPKRDVKAWDQANP
jgi:hypothetical protein